MRVRLIRKFAEAIDGVSLEGHHAGDVFDVPEADGRILMAEGWAERERRFQNEARLLAFRRSTDPRPPDARDKMSRAS